ncbi:MAG: Ku protein [Acidimicrobiia bacterium]|nr:Ku protein [Acidimicrobiia bacterium]
MARAIWSGAVSFGLVSIPVKLFNAVSRKSVSFNQLDARTGARVRQKLVSSVDGEEVTRDQVIKGYSLGADQYVQVGDDELAAIMPTSQRTIELEEFVDLAEIDPVFYDSAYWLVPDQAATKPYALLSQAMDDAQKVGIARFVMRSKQYVAAIRPRDGKLVLSTMVYADELNSVDELPEIEAAEKVELNEREVAMAVQLVDSLSADFEPDKYRDTYREQVLDLIERKAAGEVLEAPAPAEAEESRVVDLLAALEASVQAAKESRGNHPATRAAEGKVKAKTASKRKAAAEDDAEEAEPAPARKPRARKSA